MEDLKQSPLCNGLTDEQVQTLQNQGEFIEQFQGDPLFEMDEPGKDFFMVLDGLVKISVPDPLSERRKTLALLGSGEVLGEMAVLTNNNRSGRATPARDTKLFRLPREDFLEIFRTHPQLGLNLSKILSKRLWDTDSEIQSTTFKTIPGRLASQLVHLGEEFGDNPQDDDTIRIEIELTHQELADIVGTNRETITRHLNKFRDKDIISYDDNQIIIHDWQRLKGWM